MSAAEALRAARSVGIRLKSDGDDLVLEASVSPPAAVIDLLSRHKAEIVSLLQPAEDGWSAEDWQILFDELAGIAEFDGGLPRAEAEARALDWCVVEWLNHNPERSAPGRCLDCGGRDYAHDPLLPYGVESTGHAWLHSRCWPAWYEARKAKAVAALKAMGIEAPVSLSMEQQQQSAQVPSDAARESHTEENQFAFQGQMNGG
jgi:hypothetical protein